MRNLIAVKYCRLHDIPILLFAFYEIFQVSRSVCKSHFEIESSFLNGYFLRVFFSVSYTSRVFNIRQASSTAS